MTHSAADASRSRRSGGETDEIAGDRLAGRAELYLAATDEWTADGELERTLGLLSAAERRRYERFRVAAPARAFATGRALTRQALALLGGSAPAAWHLEPDEHGRPRIVAPPGCGLEFNLSHNDRLVACLVTGAVPCGIDVESPDRRVDPLRIAEHSFDETEARDLECRDGDDRRRRFFAYWTLKEAYLKARGRGIAMRMDSAVFRFPATTGGAALEVDFASRTGDEPAAWQFALYRAAGGELVAVALRRDREADLELAAFSARPRAPRAAGASLTLVAASRPAARTGR